MTGGATPLPPRAEIARKALHLLTALIPVGWALSLVTVAEVRVASVALAAIALLLEALRRRLPALQRGIDSLVGPLLRPSERQGIMGATWLAVAIALAVLALPARAAITALWAVAVGDALAALVGAVGRRTGPGMGSKTIRGSVACAMASAFGAWWLAAATLLPALLVGLAAALAERPRVTLDDNLRVTLAAGLTAWAVGVA